jgi:hypothetical protein
MQKALLRRVFRSIPRPSEYTMPQTAEHEAKLITDTLKLYGIQTNLFQLYTCLYGRCGPIPAYYHWRQKSKALHWIDFKILTAIRALPREIVIPVPLVTITEEFVQNDQPWYSSVHQILGIRPTTHAEIKTQVEEMSNYIKSVGFTYSAEQAIRSELEKTQHTGIPEITLNLMRYMIGQFCHRRMFVFTWTNYRAKWEQLSKAFNTWFSIFEWQTMQLAGKGGKQEAPGINLLIEPGSYTSLNNWLRTKPKDEVLNEFIKHFKCHQEQRDISQGGVSFNASEQLKTLMQYWDRTFFEKT